MQTIQRGNAAEGAVFAALVRAGIPALLPFGQGLPFDLAAIVPPHGEVVRIQVKSGRVREGCIASTPAAPTTDGVVSRTAVWPT